MHHTLYVALLLASLPVLGGCSTGHHADSDDHHNADAVMASQGHEDSHGDEEHHDSEIGKPGYADAVDHVLSVGMDDAMRFTPGMFKVAAGETVQFDIVNNEQLDHEFVLGSADEVREHHALMQKFPGMEHDEPNSVSLASAGRGIAKPR